MTHLDDGADLRAVMDRSLRDLDTPDCGPSAIATGRRMRTRRRAGAAVAGVGAVAVMAALVVPALGGSDSSNTQTPVASDPPPSEVPTPDRERPAGWWDVPSTAMVGTLESLLPDDVTLTSADTTSDGPDGEIPGFGGLAGVLTADTGPGSFQIILYASDPDDVSPPVAEPGGTPSAYAGDGSETTTAYAESAESLAERLECRGYHDRCEPIVDESGTQVGRRSSETSHGNELFEVFLLGPDGGALNFTVMDSTGAKPGYEASTADAPPLSLRQLRELAEAPAWTSWSP